MTVHPCRHRIKDGSCIASYLVLTVLFGVSGLKDKVGEQLAPEFVTITDNPTKENGMNFQLFDFEGVPTQETTIIKKVEGLTIQ